MINFKERNYFSERCVIFVNKILLFIKLEIIKSIYKL